VAQLAGLVDLIGEGVISGKIAKDVLALLLAEEKGADPRALVHARGLVQVNDAGAIETAVDAVIAANAAKAVEAKGKPGMLGWFVGQVMKQTGGKANPQSVSEALKRKLGLP
jgi:aspartyl-tRNA(Asn)/glutamyl-tRNA(Gln) amidotransferase subunit B